MDRWPSVMDAEGKFMKSSWIWQTEKAEEATSQECPRKRQRENTESTWRHRLLDFHTWSLKLPLCFNYKKGKKTLDRLLGSYREGSWVNHCFQEETARAIKQRFRDMGARRSQRDITMEAAIAWDLSCTGWIVEDRLHTNMNAPIPRNQHKNMYSQFCATYNQKLN